MDHKTLTPAEREAAIRRILDAGLTDTRPSWRTLPLSALLFGVEDCLFLSGLLTGLGAVLAFPAARRAPEETVLAMVFLLSPMLYAASYLLTLWKDSMSGTLDWKRTCRIPLRTVLALRMLLFGGAAAVVDIPAAAAFWVASGLRFSLPWLLGLSFSSLFLYGALSLSLQERGQLLAPPALWTALSLLLARWEDGLLQVPAAVFLLLAGGGLACCLWRLRRMLDESKGAEPYAVR